MSIYGTRFMREEVEPKDVINTPEIDEIGAELKEIEKAILGDDGIGGNTEDIADADLGFVGDPFDEAYHIIYEGEKSFGNILKTIGINEASILEEAEADVDDKKEDTKDSNDKPKTTNPSRIKTFFQSVKKWFVEMGKRIAEFFSKFMNKIRQEQQIDAKFMSDNAKAINDGYDDMNAKKETIKAQRFDVFKSEGEDWLSTDMDELKKVSKYYLDYDLKHYKSGKGIILNAESIEEGSMKRMKVDGLAKDMEELPAALKKKLQGEVEDIPVKDINPGDIQRDERTVLKRATELYNSTKHILEAGSSKLASEHYANTTAEYDENILSLYTRYFYEIKADIRIANMKAAAYFNAANAYINRNRKAIKIYLARGKGKAVDANAAVSESFSIVNMI